MSKKSTTSKPSQRGRAAAVIEEKDKEALDVRKFSQVYSILIGDMMTDLIVGKVERKIDELAAEERLPAYNVEYTLIMTQNVQKLTELSYDQRLDDIYLDETNDEVSQKFL